MHWTQHARIWMSRLPTEQTSRRALEDVAESMKGDAD